MTRTIYALLFRLQWVMGGGNVPMVIIDGSGKSCGGTQQIKILEVKNGIKVLGEHK